MKQMEIVNGAEMIGRAAMDAGVNFFAGYPITPASSIYTTMLNKLQAEGKIALGVSDEISAITMCTGAALRGAKAMSATAAPGLSLMIETIGYAYATETPLLIVLGQRLGPSTGAATQSAEGDISFVSNLISGGYQIPVFAPNSIANCYETTIRAINCSEKYRTPVILLTEKDIIMSLRNIDTDQIPELEIINRPKYNPERKKPYKTYDFDQLADVPEFVQAGGQAKLGFDDRVVVTASTHNKAGLLSKTSPEALEVIEHMRAKIVNNLDDYTYYQRDFDTELGSAEKCITVISFLATDLAAREAIRKARANEIKVNHLTLFTLFPVPEKLIKESIENASSIIIPEENHQGQYADMIRHLFLDKNNKAINYKKVNCYGRLINPSEILEAITSL